MIREAGGFDATSLELTILRYRIREAGRNLASSLTASPAKSS
jgi:hypothetical protein